MLEAPEILKWNKERPIALNLLCATVYIVGLILLGAVIVVFSFISALFSLAMKS